MSCRSCADCSPARVASDNRLHWPVSTLYFYFSIVTPEGKNLLQYLRSTFQDCLILHSAFQRGAPFGTGCQCTRITRLPFPQPLTPGTLWRLTRRHFLYQAHLNKCENLRQRGYSTDSHPAFALHITQQTPSLHPSLAGVLRHTP